MEPSVRNVAILSVLSSPSKQKDSEKIKKCTVQKVARECRL